MSETRYISEAAAKSIYPDVTDDQLARCRQQANERGVMLYAAIDLLQFKPQPEIVPDEAEPDEGELDCPQRRPKPKRTQLGKPRRGQGKKAPPTYTDANGIVWHSVQSASAVTGYKLEYLRKLARDSGVGIGTVRAIRVDISDRGSNAKNPWYIDLGSALEHQRAQKRGRPLGE